MENKNKIIISIICALIVITIGTSYALLRSNVTSTNPYTMNVGLLNITFKNNIHNLSLSNAYPMSDTDGMELNDELIFTIKNTGELDALYNVYIEETSTSPEFKTKIRYASSKDNGVTYSDIKTLGENKYIEQNGLLEQNGEVTYNVKCWLDESADNTYMNKVFTAKIVVESKQYREATFLPGSEFNVKIKELAGTDTSGQIYRHNQPDLNIISIEMANDLPSNFIESEENILSTNDSLEKIYGWFDNGILYYFSNTKKIYLNYSASHMFRALNSVQSIDLETIDTSRTYNMSNMFFWCSNLKSIDLSNFNTLNVTNMSDMFKMYQDNTYLTSLDLSSFDMSNVNTNLKDIISNVPALRNLKTPKVYPSNLTIELPKTLYDESGNAYTTLDSTSPTEEWLKVSW